MNGFADKVFLNGSIYTVDESYPWAQAVAIKDGKIQAVGKDTDIIELIGADTKVINLKKKLMLPGFIDSHAHPIAAGFLSSGLAMDMNDSLEETLEKVKQYVEKNPNKEIYFGSGFQENLITNLTSPKTLLDEIEREKPILLVGSGGHTGWCNSKALEMADINERTIDPIPNLHFYAKDENNQPNGLLVETWGNLTRDNKLQPYDIDSVKKNLARVSDEYTKAGVTAIQDGGAWPGMLDIALPMLTELIASGKFNQRIQGCMFLLTPDDREGIVDGIIDYNQSYDDDSLRINYLKILNDGVFEGKTAAMIEPYDYENSMCTPMFYGESLKELFIEAAQKGLDICVHGIGDWTIRETLLATKHIREKGYNDIRVTSIHTVATNIEDLELFKEYGVIANTTPVWLLENKLKEKMIGDRAHNNYMMNTLLKSGAVVTFSSDYPTDWYGKEPLKGIEMGITRQLYGHPDMPILKPLSERLTVAKMIKGYTIDAAYQMRMENKIGSIEEGKYADLVVLEENIFEIDPHDIHKVEIAMTVANEKIKYLK